MASLGAFAAMKSYILSLGVAMKSMFLSNAILNSLDDGVDLDKDFKYEFIEDAFANSSKSVIRSNAEEAFKNVSHDELIGKITHELMKYLILNHSMNKRQGNNHDLHR